MPPAPFDAVIFDLDGLLLDTERASVTAGVAALSGLGHGIDPAFLESLAGIDSLTGIRRISAHLGVDLDHRALDRAWGAEMRRVLRDGVPIRPGADALLDRLRHLGLPVAVATNSHTASATLNLSRSALSGRIDIVVGADAVPRGKPAPDVYLEAASRLGATPSRCLAFDDSDTGTRAARDAGMLVVQVPDLLPSREQAAHHVAPSLLDGARWAGLI